MKTIHLLAAFTIQVDGRRLYTEVMRVQIDDHGLMSELRANRKWAIASRRYPQEGISLDNRSYFRGADRVEGGRETRTAARFERISSIPGIFSSTQSVSDLM